MKSTNRRHSSAAAMAPRDEDSALKTRLLAYRPPRIAMFLLILAAAWHQALPAPTLLTSRLLAVVFGSIGFAIMMWAWWQFRCHQVAICPTSRTAYLITDGIYRYSRNPMYLGIVMMLIGVAAWFGTLPFALAAVTFFLVVELAFRPYEEQKLAETFAESYLTYRDRVRPWI